MCAGFSRATCGPPDEAEQQCGANERPAPHMDVLYGGDTQEDEDEGFTHAAPHLQEVLDAGVAALRHVGLHVLLHGHSAGHNAAKRGYNVDLIKSNLAWQLDH